MASYYVKYNNVDLTDMIKVRTVNSTVLPPRENNSILIWEKPGSIYNNYRYGDREITVTFLVMASRNEYAGQNVVDVMESKLDIIRGVLDVPSPKALYLGTSSRFIYAVPEGEFKMTELRYDCYECEVMFKCHDPFYYGSGVKDFGNTGSNNTGNGTVNITNGGNSMAYPIINIGINKDNTSFVQVENLTNGNKLKIGGIPTASKPATSTYQLLWSDPMNNPSFWDSTSSIDSNRYGGNSLARTSAGDALTLAPGAVEKGGKTWGGVAGRRDVGTEVEDFKVQAELYFTSSGKEGDPSEPTTKDDENETIGGNKNVTYYISTYARLTDIVDAPNDNADIIDYVPSGRVVDILSMENGWAHVSYKKEVWTGNGYDKVTITGYIKSHLIKQAYRDSTTQTHYETSTANARTVGQYTIKNVVTRKTGALRYYVWSNPSTNTKESSVVGTIMNGVVLRVTTTNNNDFYKLYVPYNGIMGYIQKQDVVDTTEAVEYSVDDVKTSSDEQTGVCEIYGWSANNTKLFKLSLSDDNAYSDITKPEVQVGSSIVLQDNSSVPKSNTSNNSQPLTITEDPLLDGSTSNWNDFYGELGIQRKGGKWKAWVYKMKNGTAVKKLELKEQVVNNAPTEKLSYITIYMGVLDSDNRISMSIANIKVTSMDARGSAQTSTPTLFMKGDKLSIDCYNNRVYLNNKIFNEIDVGSGFIGLPNGSNEIKVTSDDTNIVWSVSFNERYI